MKIVVTYKGEYDDMINSYYNLEQYNDDSKEEVLFQGYATIKSTEFKNQYKNYKKRCYLNLEAPTSFTSTVNSVQEQNYFTHVFSICPYTCNWLNGKSNTKYIPIAFPYAATCFQNISFGKKVHDVIYMGSLLGQEHYQIIDILKQFNYIHTSLFNYAKPYQPTYIKIHSSKKWDLLAKTKINVVLNLAPINNRHKSMIKQYTDWQSNKAFHYLEDNYIPQFKPRVIEAMVCKTLVLVKRDKWNVIEKWFEPNKHFIYWDNINDLRNKIIEIINNYDKYTPIIENAYSKVTEYEINNIYQKIILNDKN